MSRKKDFTDHKKTLLSLYKENKDILNSKLNTTVIFSQKDKWLAIIYPLLIPWKVYST